MQNSQLYNFIHPILLTHITTLFYCSACKAYRRIILSGTPVQNDLDELYAVVSFVAPGYLGECFCLCNLPHGYNSLDCFICAYIQRWCYY